MCNIFPNVVNLRESTEKGVIRDGKTELKTGVHYITLDFIEGQDLFDYVSETKLSIQDA